MTLVPNQTSGEKEFDNFVLGNFPIKTFNATILTNQVLVRGTLLGKISSGGKLKALSSLSGDGSQNPYAILIEDIDTTGGDKVAKVYVSGDFNAAEVVLVYSSDEIATYIDACRDLGIYLQDIVTGVA